MATGAELTSVETVHEDGSWLFTTSNAFGEETEVILVPCEDSVEAWVNNCTHESQRLDRGQGAAIRDGQVICPRHGSMFDTCSGDCDNGEAADTTLVDVAVTVEDGLVYLTDDYHDFVREGPAEDDDTPGSSSHLSL